MKKTIVLIRHAKSSWTGPYGISDFERPLNERGEHDAPMMGKRLKEIGLMPDLILASSARRSRQTAKRIADAMGYSKNMIHLEDRLYHCDAPMFEQVIREQNEAHNIIFIVAHNPGITDFANHLSEKFTIDNMPTCSIVAASGHWQQWTNWTPAYTEEILFEYPKQFYDSK